MNRKSIVRAIFAGLMLLLGLLFGQESLQDLLGTDLDLQDLDFNRVVPATVLFVVDGDTFDVEFEDGTQERIRMLDIDTPELFDDGGNRSTCYGEEASLYAKEKLCGNASGRNCNRTVYIELDPQAGERDRFDRILAHVYLESTQEMTFNERLLIEGYAVYNDFGNPGIYAGQYRDAERVARQQGQGIWSACFE